MYHYEIPLLEKKLENIILYRGTNDSPFKSDINILKDLIKLKDFILEKLPSYKKVTLLVSTVHTDEENVKKADSSLKPSIFDF